MFEFLRKHLEPLQTRSPVSSVGIQSNVQGLGLKFLLSISVRPHMGIKDIIDLVARAGPDWAPLLLAFLATYATARYLWKSRGKRGWRLMSDKWFGIVMLSSCLKVTTNTGSSVMLIDGGYCANNPTLYAIADAVNALGKPHSALRVVSIGVGVYPEPKRWGMAWLFKRLLSVQLLQKTLNINTFSMEQLRAILFKDVETVRINDTFERPEMATDLMESDLSKLNMLYQRGGESFAKHEAALKELLGLTAPPAGKGE